MAVLIQTDEAFSVNGHTHTRTSARTLNILTAFALKNSEHDPFLPL